MTWKTIRLELAVTDAFPRGSVSRTYLLTLPLDEHGEIESQEVARNPHRATFRRFWPSEADEVGQVMPNSHGWALRCETGDEGGTLHLRASALRLGEEVTISGGDVDSLPFRVASISRLGLRSMQ